MMCEPALDERFFLSSREALVRGATRLVGSAEAEDVVHDAFERALRAPFVRPGTDARPWLNRIARNVALDKLRARRRSERYEPVLALAESAERVMMRGERDAEIGAMLATLPDAHRRTIVLHDLQGYSNAEIATLDGVPYNTVRTRLFRARRALRAGLLTVAA